MKNIHITKIAYDLSDKMRQTELIISHLSLLSACVGKDKTPSEKGLTLYLNLEYEGALANISEQLTSVNETMAEALYFLDDEITRKSEGGKFDDD